MRDIVFTLCRFYGDVWMRKTVDTSNIGVTINARLPTGKYQYKYTLIHVDDLIVVNP